MNALLKMNNDTVDDLVIFLTNPEVAENQPSSKQLEELEYYEIADNLIRRYGSLHPTPKLLLTRINRIREQQNKKPISLKTAYNYIYNSQRLFGAVRAIEKPYWRSVMFMKEFARYEAAVLIGDQKAAKGASNEMRRWGAIHIDDSDKIDKREIGEKNQILIINAGPTSIGIDLDDTFNLPPELLEKITVALEQYNNQRMFDKLAEGAQDAEYTTTDTK